MAQNIGYLLKERRTKLEMSLEEVASIIKVRSKYLQILEEDIEENESPPSVYMLGYLKLYANFLGLDGKQIIDQLSVHARDCEFPINDINNVNSEPSKKLITISILLLILLLILFSGNIS